MHLANWQKKLVLQTTLLENLFSNTQEKGPPSVVSSRKPQPGTTRQDHHKQRTTKIACDSKITPEMRHKIVTNNGHLPKCVTSGLKAFRIHSSQAKICLHSAPEARCTSFTLLFLSRRHVQGPHHGRRPRARRGGRFRRRQTPAKTGDDHRQYASRQHAGVLRRPA